MAFRVPVIWRDTIPPHGNHHFVYATTKILLLTFTETPCSSSREFLIHALGLATLAAFGGRWSAPIPISAWRGWLWGASVPIPVSTWSGLGRVSVAISIAILVAIVFGDRRGLW
jgi:hypothetical protein